MAPASTPEPAPLDAAIEEAAPATEPALSSTPVQERPTRRHRARLLLGCIPRISPATPTPGRHGSRAHASLDDAGSEGSKDSEEAECTVLQRRDTLEAYVAFQTTSVVGLPNIGNTCFMNSALQCLLATPPLSSYFLSGEWCNELNRSNPLGTGCDVAEGYARLLTDLWPEIAQPLKSGAARRTRTRREAVGAFKRLLERHRPELRGNRQHDAHELTSFLLDGLHEDLNRCTSKPVVEDCECHNGEREDEVAAESWGNYLRRDRSIVVDLFQGQLRSTVACDACGHTSTRFDPYMYLSLPLPRIEPACAGCWPCGAFGARKPAERGAARHDAHVKAGPLELSDCLREFFEEEGLSAENRWWCPECKQTRDARKRISIYKLPPVLIVHLKRYTTHRGCSSAKRNDAVSFPVSDVDLGAAVASSYPVVPRYSLYAVCRHHGSISHGHYTANVLRSGRWYDVNDERVREVPAASVSSPEALRAAYLLFYIRHSPGDAPPPSTESYTPSNTLPVVGDPPTSPSSATSVHPAPVVRVPRQSVNKPEYWPFPIEIIPARFKGGQASSAPAGVAAGAGAGGGGGAADGGGVGDGDAGDVGAVPARAGDSQRSQQSENAPIVPDSPHLPAARPHVVKDMPTATGRGTQSQARAGTHAAATFARAAAPVGGHSWARGVGGGGYGSGTEAEVPALGKAAVRRDSDVEALPSGPRQVLPVGACAGGSTASRGREARAAKTAAAPQQPAGGLEVTADALSAHPNSVELQHLEPGPMAVGGRLGLRGGRGVHLERRSAGSGRSIPTGRLASPHWA